MAAKSANVTARVQPEITGLSFMPSRYPLTDEEPWRANGIHRMPVKSFLVY